MIDKLLSNMVSELRPRINKLHDKLMKKYLNKGQMKLLKPWWDDADPNQLYVKNAIIHW